MRRALCFGAETGVEQRGNSLGMCTPFTHTVLLRTRIDRSARNGRKLKKLVWSRHATDPSAFPGRRIAQNFRSVGGRYLGISHAYSPHIQPMWKFQNTAATAHTYFSLHAGLATHCAGARCCRHSGEYGEDNKTNAYYI